MCNDSKGVENTFHEMIRLIEFKKKALLKKIKSTYQKLSLWKICFYFPLFFISFSWGNTLTDAYWVLYPHILFSDKPKGYKTQKLTLVSDFKKNTMKFFMESMSDSNFSRINSINSIVILLFYIINYLDLF